MISEEERKNRDRLFKLMQENPHLPVIPFVDTGVVAGDDFSTWMGSWGSAGIDEYLMPNDNYSPVMLKSENDVFDVLEEYLSEKEFEALPQSEDACRPIYDALPWRKAIIVNICAPSE